MFPVLKNSLVLFLKNYLSVLIIKFIKDHIAKQAQDI
jgi:hypothetical protein